MANIVTFVEDLDAVLKDGTAGVNAHLSAIETSAPQLQEIRSAFDRMDNWTTSPALLAQHQGVMPSEGSQNARDWTHEVLFKYRYRAPAEANRRKAAGWTLHALMRAISPRESLPDISGILELRVLGATTELWDMTEDLEDVLLMARVEFDTREQLP